MFDTGYMPKKITHFRLVPRPENLSSGSQIFLIFFRFLSLSLFFFYYFFLLQILFYFISVKKEKKKVAEIRTRTSCVIAQAPT